MSKSTDLESLVRAGISPRGLSRAQAAAYINVSPGTFDSLVDKGLMPKARKMGDRNAWDRQELDSFFSRLPYSDGTEPEAAGKPGAEAKLAVWDRPQV